MHYYPHHIGDYLKDTAHLSLIEDAIYRRLLDLYYIHEKPLVDNIPFLARQIRAKQHEAEIEVILLEFFKKTPAGWSQVRCNLEIKQYNEICSRNRLNGQQGGRPRKTQSVISGEPKQNPDLTQTKANQEPRTKNHSKKLSVEKEPSTDFLSFWKQYPKKTGKGAAMKLWNKLKPPIDQVLKALYWQCRSEQWQNGFIPNPATYLNQGRWQDEPEMKLGGGAAQVIYEAKPIQRDKAAFANGMALVKGVLNGRSQT